MLLQEVVCLPKIPGQSPDLSLGVEAILTSTSLLVVAHGLPKGLLSFISLNKVRPYSALRLIPHSWTLNLLQRQQCASPGWSRHHTLNITLTVTPLQITVVHVSTIPAFASWRPWTDNCLLQASRTCRDSSSFRPGPLWIRTKQEIAHAILHNQGAFATFAEMHGV